MKRTIRLTESQLHKVIKESVRKVLSESKQRKSLNENSYRGCKNVNLIWHGSWSDPELEANGCVANYNAIEDNLWYQFLKETGHRDNESGNPEVEDEFSRWVQAHERAVIAYIEEYADEY